MTTQTTHPISPLGPVKLAITMDDMLLWRGVPVPKNYTSLGITRAMTQALARHRATDTFAFSNTAPAEDDPELLRVFDHWVEQGHHIANHTHHHPSINWVDAQTYIGDIERTEEIVAALTGKSMRPYFRPPYGDYDASVNADIARLGFTQNVLWTIDSTGWRGVPAGTIMKSPFDIFWALPPSMPVPRQLSPSFMGAVSLPPVTSVAVPSIM